MSDLAIVDVRPLAETDSIVELTKLLHAAYAQLAAQGFNFTAVDQSEDVTRSRIKDNECYVVEDAGQLVGTILFFPKHRGGCAWFERDDVSVFGQFGVLPEFQGSGVGSQMLQFMEQRARAFGSAELALDTSEDAIGLIAWYERRGYRAVDHAQWEGKVYRSIILSKRLP